MSTANGLLILKRMGIDGFQVAIITAIVVVYFMPGPDITQAPASLETLASYGLSLIFFSMD